MVAPLPPQEPMGAPPGPEVGMVTCPKCGFAFRPEEGQERGGPEGEDDLQAWFDKSRPDAALRRIVPVPPAPGR